MTDVVARDTDTVIQLCPFESSLEELHVWIFILYGSALGILTIFACSTVIISFELKPHSSELKKYVSLVIDILSHCCFPGNTC